MIASIRNTVAALVIFLLLMYIVVALPFLGWEQFKIWIQLVFHGEGLPIRIFHTFLIVIAILFGGGAWFGLIGGTIIAGQAFISLLLDWDNDRHQTMKVFNAFFDKLTFWYTEERLDGR